MEGGGGYANELKSKRGGVVREDGGINELGRWKLIGGGVVVKLW